MAQKMTPLSSIFVLADHLSIELSRNGVDEKGLQMSINALEQRFGNGNYRDLLRTLHKILGPNPHDRKKAS